MTRSSPLDTATFHFVQTLDDAWAFKRWLGTTHANNAVSFDTETTGLSAYEPGAAVRLAQFGDTEHGWAIPWGDWRGLILEALNAWEGDLVTHHSKFDVNWVETHSNVRIKRHKLHDTMIQARIVDPLGSGALKTLSDQYIDRRASLGQRILDDAFKANKWDWATVPLDFPPYWWYAACDCVITAHLHGMFYPRMAPGTNYSPVYEMEMAAADILGGMERRGARVDVPYCERMREELWALGQEIREWGTTTLGINLGSMPQLGKMFTGLGVDIREVTPTGQPKIDKWQLQVIADPDNEYHSDAQLLATKTLKMRQAEKTAQSYFRNFAEKSIDEIVHPSIHTIGARTARMSISEPSLQQVPKRDATVRRAFIPREGNVLITSDYNQIEMRMVAHFSGDRDLAGAFETADRTGSDFFTELGKSIYTPDFQKTDKRRSLIKNTLYGMCYGAGAAKMAESAGVPIDKMKGVIKDIETRFPGIRGFMKSVEDIGVRRERLEGEGYVITPLGRRLPCDSGRVYALTNYMIQSTAADCFKQGLIRLDAAGYSDWMILPVHDEIVLDVPVEHVKQTLYEVPEILSDKSMGVPITADADGPWTNWGAKYS
jgi:DNA polymerase I